MDYAAVLLLALPLILCAADSSIAAEGRWKKHVINATSSYECAGVGDINGDGKLDIVCGDSWYEAPTWKRHHFRDVAPAGHYYKDFSNFVTDVNGDGLPDVVIASYFDSSLVWVEHPKKLGDPWVEHPIDKPGPIEALALADINGDGKPELLPNSVNVVVWYEWKPGKGSVEWIKHDLGTEGAGHGVGYGDVNGDGRVDIITPTGWFEHPANPADKWVFHKEFDLGPTGLSILAYDVDGDGLSDIVWGMGHDYGMFWLKQTRGPGGSRQWEKRTIDKSWSESHVLMPVDLDSDGDPWLVTGKRVYAHEAEPGATDAPCVYAYRYNKKNHNWDKMVISESAPAANAPATAEERNAQKDFAPNSPGTGLEITAVDLFKNGGLCLVCPGKTGLYVFEDTKHKRKPKK